MSKHGHMVGILASVFLIRNLFKPGSCTEKIYRELMLLASCSVTSIIKVLVSEHPCLRYPIHSRNICLAIHFTHKPICTWLIFCWRHCQYVLEWWKHQYTISYLYYMRACICHDVAWTVPQSSLNVCEKSYKCSC